MSRPRGSRWIDILAVAVVLWIAVAIWRSALPGDTPHGRVDTLRAAFDRASAQCYDTYRGVELQACLVGVMEAHLHALGGGDEEELDLDVAPAQAGMALRL